MRNEIFRTTKEHFQSIADHFGSKVNKVEDLQRNAEQLESLNDQELRISIKNPYFVFGKYDGGWPLTNFLECPEMVSDPVFKIMHKMYLRLEVSDKYHKNDRIQGLRHSLSELANKMANRTMREYEYKSILNKENTVFLLLTSLEKASLVAS